MLVHQYLLYLLTGMNSDHQEDLEEDVGWETKNYTFFVSHEEAMEILLSGIITRWIGRNEHDTCIIHTTAVKAKRIFQVIALPKGLLWEDPVLGTCMWTLLL